MFEFNWPINYSCTKETVGGFDFIFFEMNLTEGIMRIVYFPKDSFVLKGSISLRNIFELRKVGMKMLGIFFFYWLGKI
jgi:hypothetical protein